MELLLGICLIFPSRVMLCPGVGVSKAVWKDARAMDALARIELMLPGRYL